MNKQLLLGSILFKVEKKVTFPLEGLKDISREIT